MADPAISVKGIGKEYRLGREARKYKALRDVITDSFRGLFKKSSDSSERSGGADHFWALRDVSFEVSSGQVLGIIGRNGAGKSTLLKVLSRITEPTEGRVAIRGRMGSLLEVGTGFHPELTGRENIYFNGAILGMSRADITRKFDEIVTFAEVEKFLDTPVKHYSSGMQTRLAFAVAAHLEAEIVLLDEVLSVGDLRFQKKCLGKMSEVAQSNRTILLVSHQLNQIRRLCTTCLWLDGGRVRMMGPTATVASAYEAALTAGTTESSDRGNQAASFESWAISDLDSEDRHALRTFGPFSVEFSLRVRRQVSAAFHGISLYNTEGQVLWGHGVPHLDLSPGCYQVKYRIASLPLKPGPYRWLCSLYEAGRLVDLWECTPELIVGTDPQNNAQDNWTGVLNFPFEVTFVGPEESDLGLRTAISLGATQ